MKQWVCAVIASQPDQHSLLPPSSPRLPSVSFIAMCTYALSPFSVSFVEVAALFSGLHNPHNALSLRTASYHLVIEDPFTSQDISDERVKVPGYLWLFWKHVRGIFCIIIKNIWIYIWIYILIENNNEITRVIIYAWKARNLYIFNSEISSCRKV